MSFSRNSLRMSVVKRAAAVMAALALGAACTSPVDVPNAATVQFGIPQDSVIINRTYQTTLSIRDLNGVEIRGKTATYESLFPEVATVDNKGVVTPRAVGQATIRATVDGRTAQATLKVLDRVTRVVISPATDQFPVGQNRSLIVTVTGTSGQSIAGRIVTWRTSNAAVATVNAAGVVSGVTRGAATITASVELDAVDGTASINVTDVPVTSVTVSSPSSPIMRLSATLQATATMRDVNGNILTGRPVTWSSSNPAVATVSNAGLVTAAGLGNATITAESEGRAGSMNVSVTLVPIGAVTLVALDTLVGGDQKQYNPVVTDSAGRPVTSLAGRSVNWSSTNIPVASVSTQGIVVASNSQTGTAEITVQIDGAISNVLKVQVVQVASLVVTPSPVSIRAGATQQLTVVPQDANGNTIRTSRPFGFACQNQTPQVATCSPSGLITALNPGQTTVLVTMQGVQLVTPVQVTVTP